MNRRILIWFFVFAVLAGFAFAASHADAAIVSCGRNSGTAEEQQPCTTCDILVLISNIINYITTIIVPALATLFFLFAGFLIILGGGIPSQVQRGQSIFRTTVYGLLIIYSSWLLANTVVQSLAGENNASRSWFKVDCVEPVYKPIQPGTEQPGQPGQPGQPSGVLPANIKNLASNIKSAPIKLSTNAGCGGIYNASQNIIDMSEGKFPAVCSPDCKCVAGGATGAVYVDETILNGILAVATQFPNQVMVESLTTGKHSKDSKHYLGLAVDLIPTNPNKSEWRKIRDFISSSLGGGSGVFCESPSGDMDSQCTASNHIHWQLSAGQGVAATVVIGTCTGKSCDSANVCQPAAGTECYKPAVNAWDAQIKAAAAKASICSGVDTVKMLKAIMSQESQGVSTAGNVTSYGLMQLQPATANDVKYKTGCTTDNVDAAWLKNGNNAEAMICIAAKYLASLQNECGCNVRQLAAGYNGSRTDGGACGASLDCADCRICPDHATRRWECPWDSNDHQACNLGFKETREYAPEVEYCYSQF